MEHEAPAILVALEQSAFAAAIRQSILVYPLANIGHIVSLVFFVGAVSVMDLRLIGAFASTRPGPLIDRARRFAVGGLCGLAATGSLLFTAEASHVALNPVFQIKLALIAVGLVNVAMYEFGAKRMVAGLPAGAAMPAAARRAGYLSLAIWVVVAACGRTIAYF